MSQGFYQEAKQMAVGIIRGLELCFCVSFRTGEGGEVVAFNL